MTQEKLWTRSLIVLMGVNFSSALAFYLIMVKITEYAMDAYGLSHSMAASTITAYVISALFTRVIFGRKIDVWGVKRSLVIGSAVNVVALALYLVPMGFVELMAVRLLHGFSFAIMTGSSSAGAALVIPRSRYGEGIGYYSTMQALATGVGPFVAILLTNRFGGYTPMFACAAVVGLLALASLALLEIPARAGEDPSKATDMQGEEKSGRDGDDVRMHGIGSFVQLAVVPIASVLFLSYIGYAGILSFITSYAGEKGLSDEVSLYFVVYAAAILLTRPPVGRRVDRKGENSIIYWCIMSMALGFVVLAFVANGAMLLASAALIGFGLGATQSIIQAVIARDTPPDELGRANSTFLMSLDLGSGLGPVIIGAFIPLVGYSACYLALAGVSLCALVLYHIVHGRKQPKR